MQTIQFAACWLCILVVHAAATAFYALVAIFYWQLESTYLGYFLEFFDIGLASTHYKTIAIVHGLCAAPHAVCVFTMLFGSLTLRRLTFSVALRRRRKTPMKNHRGTIPRHSQARARTNLAGTHASEMASRLLVSFERTFGTTGFFGVRGSHYGAILVCREVAETVLQTAQAYKMSRLLPRLMLNRMYVGLIVSNCWVTAIVRVMFAKSSAVEWFLSLLLDCVLDLVASAGITLAIAHYYLEDYDWNLGGFSNELWTNDRWFSTAKNELQVVFVTSWTDLAMRVVFAIGATISLSDMKSLMHLQCQGSRVHDVANTNGEHRHHAVSATTMIVPCEEAASSTSLLTLKSTKPAGPRVEDTRLPRPNPSKRRLFTALPLLFGTWGLLLLGLHLHASSVDSISQCLLQVRPWGVGIPYCYLVALNCERTGISGSVSEVEALWYQFGRQTTERIVIRHCPALQIPPLLREFTSLNTLKVYNSSIIEWEASSAITATNHPHFALVYLVRVMLPNGEIPPGLLSSDIPPTMVEITICVSNLRRIPDDLDTLWPRGLVLNIELGELTAVADCLARLRPKILSLYGNPIETLPPALFEVEGMAILGIGGTKVLSLPEDVNSFSSTLSCLIMTNAAISFFWEWIDAMARRAASATFPPIFASGTPYCTAYARIENGSIATFPQESGSGSSLSLLMDAQHHWQDITKTVTCYTFFPGPLFGLSSEDALAAAEQ